jgi:UDP-GlcNAc:undecaprenyl-phosphate GlcNAc-1-phosphate transferase
MMLLLAFVAAVLASALLTHFVRDIASARKWLSAPTSDRHIHTRLTPRLGGVAIFLTLWGLALIAWAIGHLTGRQAIVPDLTFKILEPASLVFLAGLIDDFYGLRPSVKFAVQAWAAVLLFSEGIGISKLSLLAGHPHLSWLVGLPLTVLWVLWITNAFNLIDGLDGLAAGCALFSTLVIGVMAILFQNESILLLTFALAGAIAGFLGYNFNPASIFLGDCGSLLIGFLLSAVALAGSQKAPTVVAVTIPIVALGLPILDVAVAILRRFLSRNRLFDPDREHIHHKLIGRGISHQQAVLVLYGVSACFGFLSLFLLHPVSTVAITFLMAGGFGVLVGLHQLRYHEFLELERVASRAFNQRLVIANDIKIRRAPEALQSCTTFSQFCQVMQQCFQPAGFDGFGLHFSSEAPLGLEVEPLAPSSRPRFQFFWDRSSNPSETNWTLSLCLLKQNGTRLGSFTLYCKGITSPISLDLDIFRATRFCSAVANLVEKMQDSWMDERQTQLVETPPYEKAASAIAGRVRQSLAVPSST